MLRHEFQPGRLLLGLCLIAAGVLYAGEVAGLWRIPWFTAVPLVIGGLFLAALAAAVNRGARRRRGIRGS
ncbi:hypothetical protein KUM39_15525 [Streptomyces sp. J2-1]|uniref:hypothetical protein n=1 Tax=Streptomyces corallincola TaxID=2851888 RepID=UPI001C3946B7|nr:hypothetical protein [Streptomyces corallincola]MBV2355768.1 hypothetical protein [Streptomyces corallincola]